MRMIGFWVNFWITSLLLSSFAFATDYYPDAQSKYVVERTRFGNETKAIQDDVTVKVEDLQIQIDQYENDKSKCTSRTCEKRIEDNIAALKKEQDNVRAIGVQKTMAATRAFVSDADLLAVQAFMNESILILQTDRSITDVRIIQSPFPLPDGFDACAASGGRWNRLPSFMMACREMLVEFKYQSRYYRVRLASGLLNEGFTHNGMDSIFDMAKSVANKDLLFSQKQPDFMKNVTAGYLLFGTATGRPTMERNNNIYYWFGSDVLVGVTRLF